MTRTERKIEVKAKTSALWEKTKSFFGLLCRNSMIISKDSEIFRMPLIVFAVILLSSLEFFIPVMLIALFCGVEFTFSGVDFADSTKLSFR